MSFKSSLILLLDNYGKDILNDKFRTHSILSDYIKNDIYSKKELSIFTLIYDYVIESPNSYQKSKITPVNSLDLLYKRFNDKCSIELFKTVIMEIYEVIYDIDPNFSKQVTKFGNVNKVAIKKNVKVVKNNPIKAIPVVNNNKNVVNNNTPNKPRGLNQLGLPKLKLHNLLGLSVIVNDVNLVIVSSGSDEFQILKSKTKSKITPQRIEIKNGILYIDLRQFQNTNLLIKVPDITYDSIYIDGSPNNLQIGTSLLDKVKVNKIDINTESTDITLNIDSKDLHINNMDGNINMKGKIEEVRIFNTNGNINYNLDTTKVVKIRVRINAVNTNITGSFTNGAITPPVKQSQNDHLITKGMINNTDVVLFITTTNGVINVK